MTFKYLCYVTATVISSAHPIVSMYLSTLDALRTACIRMGRESYHNMNQISERMSSHGLATSVVYWYFIIIVVILVLVSVLILRKYGRRINETHVYLDDMSRDRIELRREWLPDHDLSKNASVDHESDGVVMMLGLEE